MKVKLSTAFTLLIIISVMLMSIGYASINNISEEIIGTASASVPAGIYITEATLLPNESVNYDTNITKVNDFSKTTLNTTVFLNKKKNNKARYVTFEVKIYNGTNETAYYVGPTHAKEFFDNENFIYKVTGAKIGYELAPQASVTLKIKFKYKRNMANTNKGQVLNSYVNFQFKHRYDVTYNNINTRGVPKYTYEGVPLEVDLFQDAIQTLRVRMNGKNLKKDVDYTFIDTKLVVQNPTGPIEITNLGQGAMLKVTYINIDPTGKPREVGYQKLLQVVIPASTITKFEITMGDTVLTPDGEATGNYRYTNELLLIFSPIDDIVIKNVTDNPISIPEEKFSVKYIDLNSKGRANEAAKDKPFTVDLSGEKIGKLEVRMSDNLLTLGKEYTFANNVLEIKKVTGSIEIKNVIKPDSENFQVTYVNIDKAGKPTIATKNQSFEVDLSKDGVTDIEVKMNGELLRLYSDYEWNNSHLNIYNVTGPITITNKGEKPEPVGDVTLNFINMTVNDKPKTTFSGKPFVIDLTKDNIKTLEVWVDNKLAVKGKDYTFVNNVLTVNDPINIVHIKKIIEGFPTEHHFDMIYENLEYPEGPQDDSYAYQFTLVNLTDKTSKGWEIRIKVPNDFTLNYGNEKPSGFNAEISNGVLIMTNVSWNGELPPGGSGNAKNLQLRFRTKDPSIFPLVYSTKLIY